MTLTAEPAIIEGGTATFTLTLSEAATSTLRVNVDVDEMERVGVGVNANLVPDSAEGLNRVTVRRGAMTATLSIATVADGVHEDSRARTGRTNPLTATIQTGTGYTVGATAEAIVQVKDDEAAWGVIEWESIDVSARKGDGFAELFITLSKPYSYDIDAVLINIAGGAGAGNDYDSSTASGVFTMPAFKQRKSLRVRIVDTDQLEGDETFDIQMFGNALPANLGRRIATVRIIDDDTATITLAGEPKQVTEGQDIRLKLSLPPPPPPPPPRRNL